MANQEQHPVQGFVTLHIPSQYGYLRVLRQSVLDTSVRAGLSEFDAAQLEMAVDEACANIIEHSYGRRPGDHRGQDPGIHVNLFQQKDKVVVELFDHGEGFDFDGKAVVNPEEYIDGGHERGLGMFIIHKFVDEVSYQRATPSGNCLKLTKLVK
jgi:serine/threonine-protein kinase RsbW